VVDFIDLRVWPLFNIADACIVLGAGGTLWSIL
jgi:lipoprotein signal peptidase